ncbi:PREDICTED: uncharacterized protein LOC107354153, partial [Acropora digitifera]|uniref:uncharacterized protein LOC107354153 n=1 Tax=Acropora digitifera TaxID=70779 RepID=UPI00077A183D
MTTPIPSSLLLDENNTSAKSRKSFVSVPLASEEKEGKADKKATDEEGKQYGGNKGKDNGGGAVTDKTKIQEQEHYEQGSSDDDLSAQISETTEEDLFHGIHELLREEQEELDKVAIFEGTVTSEGFHLDLNVGAIHLTFPPDTVAEPTDIMVYRWKYGACLPQLTEHEAVVSNVVEISAATEVRSLKFNREVKLVLSHSAADLEGYELVMKRLTDTEKNEWEEIAGCENIRQVSDIEDDNPWTMNAPYSFPVVRAGISKCCTYAVVSRLKLSPTYTITVSGGTFVHPDYPQVIITVPKKAVATETKLSLQLKVQEVPQDEFQCHGLFAGPVLHVLCSSGPEFLKPVTIQLPVSLRDKLLNTLHPSKCRVRIFFLNSEEKSKEWVEISDELESPASYDGKLVKFKVQRFSKYTFLNDGTSGGASAVASGFLGYLLSIVRNQPLVANFFAYFKPAQRLKSRDILFLVCCPAHLREEVKQERERDGVNPPPCHCSSNIRMIPERDKAFVLVSGGICPAEELKNFYLRLYRDTAYDAQLEVCRISDEEYGKVKFRNENNRLLSELNLILPSIDHWETPVDSGLAVASPGGVNGEKKNFCSPSPEDKPPKLNFQLKKAIDVPKSMKTWSDDYLPIDILLMTANSCDFLSCFSFLDQPFKRYEFKIGYVYFGRMGDASDKEKLKVALLQCSKGAETPAGSLTVLQKALRKLGPKAVFLVGTCISLTLEKVKIGDVVISSKLITPDGYRTPVSPLLGSLALDAPNGWVAPLENPDELDLTVHPSGDILSQSLTKTCRYDDICEQYPEAIAIETEGRGVYAAAYDANMEWLIVKGVAGYFHQGQPATNEWMSFASTMAASVMAKMLHDPTVFLEWPHFKR